MKTANEMKRRFRSLCMAAIGAASLVGCGPADVEGTQSTDLDTTSQGLGVSKVASIPPMKGKYRLKNGTGTCMQRFAGDIVSTAACTTATTGDQIFEVHQSPWDGFYTICTPGQVKMGDYYDLPYAEYPTHGFGGKCLEQKGPGSKDLRMMNDVVLYADAYGGGYFVYPGHIRDNGNGTLNWEGGGNNITRNSAGVVTLGGAGNQQWTPILVP